MFDHGELKMLEPTEVEFLLAGKADIALVKINYV